MKISLKDGGESSGSSTRCINITIHVAQAGERVLKINYMTSGASWKPVYDCRVDKGADTMQLVYYAMIRNDTKEHWRQCHLSLSTAKPNSGGQPPKMFTKRVVLTSHKVPRIQHQAQSNSNPLFQSNMLVQQQMFIPNDLSGSESDSDLEMAPSVRAGLSTETPTIAGNDDGDDDDEPVVAGFEIAGLTFVFLFVCLFIFFFQIYFVYFLCVYFDPYYVNLSEK